METGRSIWILFGVVGTRHSINLVHSPAKTILFANVNIVEYLPVFNRGLAFHALRLIPRKTAILCKYKWTVQ